jgi:hypothetical protein
MNSDEPGHVEEADVSDLRQEVSMSRSLKDCEVIGHEGYTIGSWPSGPDGEWTELIGCKECDWTYEVDH